MAGLKAKFSVKNDDVFLPIGLWSEWVADDGQIIETCTLLTDNPYKYFYEMGHDRSIVVLKDTMALELLYDRKMKAEDSFKFIREHRITQNWVAEGVSPMKEGWQKKIPSEEEIKEIGKTVF